jgi:hypothetical protein
MTEPDTQRARATALNLHGLLTHWNEVSSEPWLTPLLGWEEQERARRGFERRLRTAHIGRFKPLCDFDWSWPKRCDRSTVDALMSMWTTSPHRFATLRRCPHTHRRIVRKRK